MLLMDDKILYLRFTQIKKKDLIQDFPHHRDNKLLHIQHSMRVVIINKKKSL